MLEKEVIMTSISSEDDKYEPSVDFLTLKSTICHNNWQNEVRTHTEQFQPELKPHNERLQPELKPHIERLQIEEKPDKKQLQNEVTLYNGQQDTDGEDDIEEAEEKYNFGHESLHRNDGDDKYQTDIFNNPKSNGTDFEDDIQNSSSSMTDDENGSDECPNTAEDNKNNENKIVFKKRRKIKKMEPLKRKVKKLSDDIRKMKYAFDYIMRHQQRKQNEGHFRKIKNAEYSTNEMEKQLLYNNLFVERTKSQKIIKSNTLVFPQEQLKYVSFENSTRLLQFLAVIDMRRHQTSILAFSFVITKFDGFCLVHLDQYIQKQQKHCHEKDKSCLVDSIINNTKSVVREEFQMVPVVRFQKDQLQSLPYEEKKKTDEQVRKYEIFAVKGFHFLFCCLEKTTIERRQCKENVSNKYQKSFPEKPDDKFPSEGRTNTTKKSILACESKMANYCKQIERRNANLDFSSCTTMRHSQGNIRNREVMLCLSNDQVTVIILLPDRNGVQENNLRGHSLFNVQSLESLLTLMDRPNECRANKNEENIPLMIHASNLMTMIVLDRLIMNFTNGSITALFESILKEIGVQISAVEKHIQINFGQVHLIKAEEHLFVPRTQINILNLKPTRTTTGLIILDTRQPDVKIITHKFGNVSIETCSRHVDPNKVQIAVNLFKMDERVSYKVPNRQQKLPITNDDSMARDSVLSPLVVNNNDARVIPSDSPVVNEIFDALLLSNITEQQRILSGTDIWIECLTTKHVRELNYIAVQKGQSVHALQSSEESASGFQGNSLKQKWNPSRYPFQNEDGENYPLQLGRQFTQMDAVLQENFQIRFLQFEKRDPRGKRNRGTPEIYVNDLTDSINLAVCNNLEPNDISQDMYSRRLCSNFEEAGYVDPGCTDGSIYHCSFQLEVDDNDFIIPTITEESQVIRDIHPQTEEGTNPVRIFNAQPTHDQDNRTELVTTITTFDARRRTNCRPFLLNSQIPFSGGVYGRITLRNTCCIDGFLVMIYIVLEEDRNLRIQFQNTEKDLHKVFHQVWKCFKDEDFATGKVTWLQYTGFLQCDVVGVKDDLTRTQRVLDITGSENKRVFSGLNKNRCAVNTRCSNENCTTTPDIFLDVYGVLVARKGCREQTLGDILQLEVSFYLRQKVGPCIAQDRTGKKCTGTRYKTVIDPQVLLPINLYFLQYFQRRYYSSDIPDIIESNGVRYHLQLVRFFLDGVGHFVDKIKKGDEWTYYDDCRTKVYHFDEDPEGACLSSCYFIRK